MGAAGGTSHWEGRGSVRGSCGGDAGAVDVRGDGGGGAGED